MTGERNPKPRRGRHARMRAAVRGVFFALVAIGAIWHTGWGTYSGFGVGSVAAICPLGALEALLGGWAFVPRLLVALAVSLVVALLAGRAFCAWVCPVPPLDRFFSTRTRRRRRAQERAQAAHVSFDRYRAAQGEGGRPCKTPPRLDSRHAVLLGALGSAAVFGFPVFCLVCPVGLTCATVVAFVRLVGFNEPSWGLLVFPAIVVLELTVLRRYCARICPIAALASLVGRFGKTLRPTVDAGACLRQSKGEGCVACASACPVHIDPHSDLGLVSSAECVRCARCVDACPVGAVRIPFLPSRDGALAGLGDGGPRASAASLPDADVAEDGSDAGMAAQPRGEG